MEIAFIYFIFNPVHFFYLQKYVLNKVDGRCVGVRPESSLGFNLIFLEKTTIQPYAILNKILRITTCISYEIIIIGLVENKKLFLS